MGLHVHGHPNACSTPLLILILTLFYGITAEGQTFVRSVDFGGPSSIQATSDGGMIAAGQRFINLYNVEITLLKLRADGSTQWKRTFEGAFFNSPQTEVFPVANGGYVLTVPSARSLLKLTAAGKIQWTKTFSSVSFQSAVATNDGNIALVGEEGPDLVFAVLDAGNGEFFHTKKYSDAGTAYGGRIVTDCNGGFLIAATTDVGGPNRRDVILIKTDSEGEILASKLLLTPYDEVINSMAVSQDCNVFVLLSTGLWPVVAKVDQNGNLLYRRMFRMRGFTSLTLHSVIGKGSGCLLAGTASGLHPKGVLIRLLSGGTIWWARMYRPGKTGTLYALADSPEGLLVGGTLTTRSQSGMLAARFSRLPKNDPCHFFTEARPTLWLPGMHPRDFSLSSGSFSPETTTRSITVKVPTNFSNTSICP